MNYIINEEIKKKLSSFFNKIISIEIKEIQDKKKNCLYS